MDPNKYKKNADIKPDTLLQTITSVVSMLLMIIGIVGIATDFFREDSWIINMFAFFFESTAKMLLLPVLIFVLWLINRWISSPNKDKKNKSGNLPMYIMMLVGVYYVYRFTLS
ncbi:MAG TPA: hypothetical protein VLM20_00225 [Methylophilaceae bacterium]|nr:hypothetical protein [Methylophilaceae bacterium]